MAQQEGGWPLGLQPLNLRIDLVRNVDFSRSNSLSTLITTSSYSSSSELDSTEDPYSVTVASPLAASSVSLASSICPAGRFAGGDRRTLGGEVASSAPSLGHLLEAERRAGDAHQTSRRTGIAIAYELEGLAPGRHFGAEPNSLSSDGRILPPSNSFALLFPCMSDQVAE
ncbi:hypothetical protein ZIOFF_033115 [Zingiber officinale]|uniref:Uncharacterized protein n=1 Tax=Zingiber officinale TaxID=94328 RepID=A0A8J5GWK4_ZINOF|nr:hypothetical protein ZIOFF_033115 [Zingiber officinale]